MSEGCVILAAGQGQRMGQRNKALLSFQGQSFLAVIAGLCEHANISNVTVVVAAPHEEETRAAAMELGLACVCNPRPEVGMSSSVACGFAHALQSLSGNYCWLWPVDLPGVTLQTLLRVSALRREDAVVMPSFSKRGGHPVLVGRQLWSSLAKCEDEAQGARSVFHRDSSRVVRVAVDDPGVLRDVDHPADLVSLQKLAPNE